MAPSAGVDLFLLGFAGGLALLTVTSFRRVSPSWLQWLLMAVGLFTIGRYVTMALASMFPEQSLPRWLSSSWGLVKFVSFTLPAVFAVDQMLRHPAMTPKRLLRWYVPLPLVAAVGAAWGHRVLMAIQTASLVGVAGVCVLLMRKIPSPPIRRALLGLALGCGYLGVDNRLYPELLALAAIWHAYETSASAQS